MVVVPMPNDGVYLNTNDVTKPRTNITTKTTKLITTPLGKPDLLTETIPGWAGGGIVRRGAAGGGGGGEEKEDESCNGDC